MAVIEIDNLSKFYGRSKGIENISFRVEEGDIFGFIGPNGAGKSTTIRIMLNLIFPTSGTGKIFGMDMVKESKKIRAQSGYVPSDANLYDRMRVLEFLRYTARFFKISDCESKIVEIANLLDLDLSRKIPELSTGNKKKVAIAQALVHHPSLLILDEPTTGLDPLIQARLFDLLRQENKNGTTIFLSSHNLGEVQSFCKRVAIIRSGKIINVEEIAELRRKQLLRVRFRISAGQEIPVINIEGAEFIEKEDDNSFSFMYSGNINDVTGFLSRYRLESLTIEEPQLEEIFLHYYREGGKA